MRAYEIFDVIIEVMDGTEMSRMCIANCNYTPMRSTVS